MKKQMDRLEAELQYLEKEIKVLQAMNDTYEPIQQSRYKHKKIKHLPIKDRVKSIRECMASTDDQKKAWFLNHWFRYTSTYDIVDDLTRTNPLTPVDTHTLITTLRTKLCAIINYVPPVDRANIPEGHCRNTGLPIYLYYKTNTKIKGRTIKDVCACSSCVKARQQRTWDRAEYRKGLDDEKKRPKKDPKRYGHGD